MKKLLLVYFIFLSGVLLAQTTTISMAKSTRQSTTEKQIETTAPTTTTVEVYPNPASSEINVRLDYSHSKSMLKLYSISGAAVKDHDLSGYETKVDISSLPDGFYFYEIYSDGKLIKVGRLIKK